MSDFIAATITIPERSKAVERVANEFAAYGIPYKLYVDVEHKGTWWNQARMFMELCEKNPNKNVITTTDDIQFKSDWYDRVNRVLEKTDYEVIALFTNQSTPADDDRLGIRCARYRMWMYDQAVVWRKGILSPRFWHELVEYRTAERTKKELNHLDCFMSAYVYDKGYKCCTMRPNAVTLQKIKSSLGHNIVIKDN